MIRFLSGETSRLFAMGTDYWLPLATLVIGFGGASINEWLRDRRQEKREASAREAERALRREERRDEFQRQALLELQEAGVDLGRSVAKAHRHDLREQRESGKEWAALRLGRELDEENRLASLRARMLEERILDDELRDLVQQYIELSNEVLVAPSEAVAVAEFGALLSSNASMQARLGILLRQLY
jgi:hypothetical protein